MSARIGTLVTMSYQPPVPYAPPVAPQRGGALAWTGFGLGVGSVVLAFIPFFGLFSALTAIAGIIVSAIGLKKRSAPKWAAITGLVTSILSLIANVVQTVILGFLIAGLIGSVAETVRDYSEETNTPPSVSEPAPEPADGSHRFYEGVTVGDVTVSVVNIDFGRVMGGDYVAVTVEYDTQAGTSLDQESIYIKTRGGLDPNSAILASEHVEIDGEYQTLPLRLEPGEHTVTFYLLAEDVPESGNVTVVVGDNFIPFTIE